MKTDPNQTGAAILLGAGGHAKVVLSLARVLGWDVIGVCDPALAAADDLQAWRGVRVLGADAALAGVAPGTVALLNGVGQIPGSSAPAVRKAPLPMRTPCTTVAPAPM